MVYAIPIDTTHKTTNNVNIVGNTDLKQTKTPEEIFADLLAEAKADPNIVGFWLGGSRGKGLATQFSDWDVEFVIKDEMLEEYKKKYPRYKYPHMELLLSSLTYFRHCVQWGGPEQWGRYDFTHLKALVDKTGDMQALIDDKGKIPDSEVKRYITGELDAYINFVYRSLKCLRDGYLLGARLEATIEVGLFFDLIFALHNGRLRPFYKYLEWEIKTWPLVILSMPAPVILQKISRILDDADPAAQLELFTMMEAVFTQAGYGAVFKSWDEESMTLIKTFKT